ncbi:MAG TPA: hypothetical protein VFK44_14260 [Bacillales bacterium]|nr:hypothetical protein [Bacillales bacterium]
MKTYFVLPLILLFMLSGCEALTFTEKTAHAGGTDVRVILLYSMDTDEQLKDRYFSALLDAYDDVPVNERKISIKTGDLRDLQQEFEIPSVPAIIVKQNGMTKLKIAGAYTTETLTKKLTPLISRP